MYDDFHIFNGWLIFHDIERGEMTSAVRIEDIQSMSFEEGTPSRANLSIRVDVFTYKLRGWDHLCKVEFPAGTMWEEGRSGPAPIAWAVHDAVLMHGATPREAT